MKVQDAYDYKYKLTLKNKECETLKDSLRVHVKLMDEYRQEMIELRLVNSEVRLANKFLKKATYALRQINRKLRLTICYDAA